MAPLPLTDSPAASKPNRLEPIGSEFTSLLVSQSVFGLSGVFSGLDACADPDRWNGSSNGNPKGCDETSPLFAFRSFLLVCKLSSIPARSVEVRGKAILFAGFQLERTGSRVCCVRRTKAPTAPSCQNYLQGGTSRYVTHHQYLPLTNTRIAPATRRRILQRDERSK